MQSLGHSQEPALQSAVHDAVDTHRIAPARGIAVALALGGAGWAAILGLVQLVRMLITS